MTYKIKHKHQRISQKYFLEHEVKPHMTFQQSARVGTRRTFDIPKKIHTKGEYVEYKDRIGKVEKVTKRGIHISLLSKSDGLTGKPTKIFISQKKIEEGKVYPAMITSMPPFFVYHK